MHADLRSQGPILGTEGMDRLTPQAMKDAITRAIPLQRQGHIDDIANAGIYLFSEAANWVNGQVFVRSSLILRIQASYLTLCSIVGCGRWQPAH